MSQCSSYPCELRETQKPHVFRFDPVSNPVAPVLGNRCTDFVLASPTASCLKYRWHLVWELSGTDFH
jgi:hypothetical protein